VKGGKVWHRREARRLEAWRAAERPTSESSRFVRKLRDAYAKARCSPGERRRAARAPGSLAKRRRSTTICAVARRFLVGFLLCGVTAALVAACDEGRRGYDYVYPHGPGRGYVCSQFTSCGSCTPVEGCGWCAFQGRGACVSDPDFCGANQFSFTWDPSGCAALGGGAQEAGGATGDASLPVDAASPPPHAPNDAGKSSSPMDASSGVDADH
jgi:hypothetical protein